MTMRAPGKLSEELVLVVACSRCGAPIKQWCSQSYARRSGGTITPGDWRTPHAIRQRDALQKIVADHRSAQVHLRSQPPALTDAYLPQMDLVGCRFRPIRQHPANRGRVAIVLRVRASKTTGCGVRLIYRYEDSPPGAFHRVSQRWFLSSFSPLTAMTIDPGELP